LLGGCSVIAEVANGVWIGQEPDYDSPSIAVHIAARARRSRYVLSGPPLALPAKAGGRPMETALLDQAIDEIGDKLLEIRQKSARIRCTGLVRPSSPTKRPTSTASSPRTGERTIPITRRALCHSTTVTGVANTWGYGAMTNSYNDIRTPRPFS